MWINTIGHPSHECSKSCVMIETNTTTLSAAQDNIFFKGRPKISKVSTQKITPNGKILMLVDHYRSVSIL